MANGPHEWDMGWEYFYEGEPTRKRLMSFGFALSPWQTARIPNIRLDRALRRRPLRSDDVAAADADDGLYGNARRMTRSGRRGA